MKIVGNFLWFVLGGFIVSLKWAMVGVFMAMTIIGIPFAIASFRIAGYAAFPFGRELIDAEMLGERRIAGTGFGNFLWILFAGLWLAIAHVLCGAGLCCTLIGIPFGLAHFKLASACFAPLGKRVVSTELAAAARHRMATLQFGQMFAQQAAVVNFGTGPVTSAPQLAMGPGPAKYCHACGTPVQFSAPICLNCQATQRRI